ncbi:hypothetical protein AVEN_214698-1 [Araneus ventricosus]|uniref:Uncharacterized protein n=1 Tax=Araneus ventricosus TaxID=182803 RepID=A0A4Y2UGU4_ARAVE|nr:hypothetical protein AVEN_214698-1 [Araneus ventricosus]
MQEVPKSPVSFLCRTLGAISCQDGRSAEFSFFSRIGLIAGSSSWAFFISHEDQGFTDAVVKTFTEVSVSIPNFSRNWSNVCSFLYRIFERGRLHFLERSLCDAGFRNHTPEVFVSSELSGLQVP